MSKIWQPKAIEVEVFGVKFIASYNLELIEKKIEDIQVFHKDEDLTNHLSDSIIEQVKQKILDYER